MKTPPNSGITVGTHITSSFSTKYTPDQSEIFSNLQPSLIIKNKMIRQMSHFIYCHKKTAEHFNQLCSTETLLLHFWRAVLISIDDLALVIMSCDQTPPHPQDLGEVTRQLLGCSWKQLEGLSQPLTRAAACREDGNTHQATAEKSKEDNQLEECFMT